MDDLGYLQGFFYVKPNKAPDPNFICIQLTIHVRAALNSCLHNFTFLNCVNSNLKIYGRGLVVAIRNTNKAVEEPKSY